MIYWILWFILGIVTVVLTLYLVVNRVFLLAYGRLYCIRDRALGKFNITGGVSFMYQPALSFRKYISRYQIFMSENDKRKYFLGEWAQNVAFADYDIVVYNAFNRVINIINVKEQFNSKKYTRKTLLPDNTSFVSLKVNSMDGKRSAMPVKADRRYFVWLICLSTILSAAVVFSLWFTFAFLSEGLKSGFILSLDWAAIFAAAGLSVFFITFFVGLFRLSIGRAYGRK